MPLALRSPGLPNSLNAFLFESHYVWWFALLILAAVLILLARARPVRPLLHVGIGVLALALVWFAAALLIDTPAERLHRAHLDLADAVSKNDVDRILSHFAPAFSADAGPVKILDSTTPAQTRDIVTDALKTYGIKATIIRYYDSAQLPNHTALSHFTALTTGDQPLLTSWEVKWDDLPDQDWRIQKATLTKLGDTPLTPDLFSPRLP